MVKKCQKILPESLGTFAVSLLSSVPEVSSPSLTLLAKVSFDGSIRAIGKNVKIEKVPAKLPISIGALA